MYNLRGQCYDLRINMSADIKKHRPDTKRTTIISISGNIY